MCRLSLPVHCTVGPVPFLNEAPAKKWTGVQLCCLTVCWVLLHVGSISMSGVVCMQAGVTALCSALHSSHNQWPFCLRWWMREKCSVSTLVVHTFFFLSLSVAAFALSALYLTHAELLKVNNLHCCQLLQRSCVLLMSTHTQNHTHTRACAGLCAAHQLFVAPSAWLVEFSILLCYCVTSSMWLMLARVAVVFGGCMCVSSLQARVKNEFLDYKDLAALPKVKAIYEVQQPDLISSSYQPYHRYTSDDRLDTYCYGEVLLPHTPGQTQPGLTIGLFSEVLCLVV